MTTGKEACEFISRWLKEKHNINMKPEDIWNASETGELYHVCALYETAKEEMV